MPTPRRTRRIAMAGAVALVAALGSLVPGAAATTIATAAEASPLLASTVPGSPGVPQPPTVLYREDFQNFTPVDGAVLLTDYAGATGVTYTADPVYANPVRCNGVIFGHQATNAALSGASFCGTSPTNTWYSTARTIPFAMGSYQGLADPDSNFALAEQTVTGFSGYTGTMIEATGIPLPAGGPRFVAFSIDVANFCTTSNAQALDNFFLIEGASVTALNSVPYQICQDPARQVFTVDGWAVSVATFAGDRPALVTSPSIGFRVANAQGSGSGNDQALDEFVILDVTPQLDKEFDPATVSLGESTTLVFTVTNTDELSGKSGWSFTDTLPAGVAPGAGAVGGSCVAAGTDVTVGGGVITVENGVLADGEASCTITVPVVAVAAGASQNCPGTNVTDLVGLNPPACATLDVVPPPSIVVTKQIGPGGRLDPADQFALAVSDSSGVLGGVTTTGAAASAVSASIEMVAGHAVTVTDAMAPGSPSAMARYDQAIACQEVASGDPVVLAGAPGAWTFVPVQGVDYECLITNTARAADLVISKVVVGVADGTEIDAGTTLEYLLTFRNDGGAAAAVDVTDHVDGVLDDADVTAPTSSSPLTVGAVTAGGFRVTGSIPGGESYEVRYSAEVRPAGDRGDDVLLNFLLPTGSTPPADCTAGDPLCTSHPVARTQGVTGALGVTGGVPLWGAVTLSALLAAGGLVMITRSRSEARARAGARQIPE